jgi:acyl carrier protein
MADRTLILQSIQAVSESKAIPAEDESLFESGALDSFTLTDLASELESRFDIKIPDADLTPRKFDTIERIDAYISARQP